MANNKNLKNIGKKFSKDYQPKNKGMKKSIINKLLEEYQIANQGKTISKDDRYKLILNLLDKNEMDLLAIKNNKTMPVFLVCVAGAILSDMTKGQVSTIETVWNRLFGKPTEEVQVSNKDGKPFVTHVEITYVKPKG